MARLLISNLHRNKATVLECSSSMSPDDSLEVIVVAIIIVSPFLIAAQHFTERGASIERLPTGKVADDQRGVGQKIVSFKCHHAARSIIAGQVKDCPKASSLSKTTHLSQSH